ncbi:Acyl carrier protein [subsurface metagenome]
MDIKFEVFNVVSEIFEIPFDKIQENMTSSDIAEWDSLGQLNLIMAIENKFGIKFKVEDIFNITTVDSIKEFVTKRVNA